MKSGINVEREEMERYYFVLLGYASFKQVYQKIEELLKFYRIESQGKLSSREIIYDVPSNLLTDSGVVLSKKTEGGNSFFNVLKISLLPGNLKRPNQNHVVKQIRGNEQPADFSLDIASTIEKLFSINFTVDLDSIVKKVIPIIEINVNSENYKIIGGSGLRGYLSYEKITYKDTKTRKKVFGEGVVLRLPNSEEYEQENKNILSLIEKNIQELGMYNVSKFELAQKLLYPKEEGEEGGVETKVDYE